MKVCRFIAVFVFAGVLQPQLVAAQPKEGAPDRDSVARLIKALADPNEKVSQSAVKALVKIGEPAFVDLLTALEKGDEKTRPMVVLVLGSLRREAAKKKEQAVVDSLEEILLKLLRDPNDKVKEHAGWGLTTFEPRSTKAIPEFIAIMRNSESTYWARVLARSRLEDLGPAAAAAIPVLLDCLENKVERDVVLPDTKGLDSVAIEKLYMAASYKAKHYVLGERAGLCELLGVIGPKDPRIAKAMLKILRNPKEYPLIRANAATVLVEKMGDAGQAAVPDILGVLKETARKTDDFLGPRMSLTEHLGRLKLTRKDAGALLDIAVDRKENPTVRGLAVEALCKNAAVSQAAWGPLLQILQDELPTRLREEIVIRALGEIDPPADHDKAKLALEVKLTFDRIYDMYNMDPPEPLRAAMVKTLKKLEGGKKNKK